MKIASYEGVCFPIGLKMHKRPRDGGKELLIESSSGKEWCRNTRLPQLIGSPHSWAPSHPHVQAVTWLLSITCANPVRMASESHPSLQPGYLHTCCTLRP
jgi:hypothetical protein